MTDTNTTLYRGLEWASIRTGGKQAFSETTGGRYAIEPTDSKEQLWMVRYGFPDRPGRPNVQIGTYTDQESARVACERHDYTYWSSTVTRAGGTPVFIGSGDNDMVEALGNDADEITNLLIANADTSDGTIFAQAASFFQAQKGALKQEKNGTFTLALSLKSDALPRWLLEAEPSCEVLLGALNIGNSQKDDWVERGQRALRRAFALPSDNAFQNWMVHRYDRWKLIATAAAGGTSDEVERATAETLCRLLACPSRKELLKDREAIDKLEQLDKEFYLDLSRGFSSSA